MAEQIDLNADLGESFGAWTMGDDEHLLDVVSSANVACGFHAGDPTVMAHTCRLAAEKGTMIGAHVAYPDLVGFGRSVIDMPADRLRDVVLYQIAALWGVAATYGVRVGYVKPHGALYNYIVKDETQAEAVVSALADFGHDLAILGLPGSVVFDKARERGVRTVVEAFADRAYEPDGQLVSRRKAGSVLTDSAEISARVVRLVKEGKITAIDGSEISMDAQSICLHGDTPGAVEHAKAVRAALTQAGVEIKPFID